MPQNMYATIVSDAHAKCGKVCMVSGVDLGHCQLARDHNGQCYNVAPRQITVAPGELVLVEVPHNCAVYDTSPVGAREIARSWFDAGWVAYFEDDDDAFDRMWNAGGITDTLPEDES